MERATQDRPDTAQAPTIEAAVEALLAEMTLAEKIGQMTQVEKNSLTPQDVADYAIGSVLSGGGGNPTPNTPAAWAAMVRSFQEAALRSRLGIPLLYGVDAVHGHNNLRGATIFPHNIGLGATGDPELVARVARATARELLATNVHWNFAPAVSVPRDIRWGRTYEGFSEDTELVSALGAAYVRGLQGPDVVGDGGVTPRVLASVKHFLGDGGTAWGTTRSYGWLPAGLWQSQDGVRWQIDQGDTQVDEATLRAVHLPPYAAAIAAGARNIMVSYSSWNGLKLHAHRYLLTDVLKGELGFDGFLVSDWLAVQQLDADLDRAVALAIGAGLDMVMVPFDYRAFIAAVTRGVEAGAIALERIDDAVRRILRVKYELGLFERPFGDEGLLAEIGGTAHRQVAREAVAKSLVLLKNEGGALPLPSSIGRILVAGAAADDIGMQCGGWTIEWQGGRGPITPGTTLLEAIRSTVASGTVVDYLPDGAFRGGERAEVGVIVIGEPPYTEGEGDRADLSLAAEDVVLVERVRQHCDRLIVILLSGRPLLVEPALELSDAFIAAWLPGTEGQGGADVLFGAVPFTGHLPYAWPQSMAQVPLDRAAGESGFPRGYGLSC